MSDKTRLELDLEQQERYKVPAGVKVLIVLLIAGLCAAGAYSLKLHKELVQKEHEIAVLKEEFRKEKAAMSFTIRQLKANEEGHQLDRR